MPTPLDDRQSPITRFKPRSLKVADGPGAAERALAVKQIKLAVKAESQRWSFATVGMGLVAGVVAVGLSMFVRQFMPRTSAFWQFLPTVAFWSALIGGILVARVYTRRTMGHSLAATAVAQGFCGQCCYSLEGKPPEHDGCVVCPECGAAWRATRLTTVAWADDARKPTEPMPAHTSGERRRITLLKLIGLIPRYSNRLGPDHRDRIVPIPDSRFWVVPRTIRDSVATDILAAARREARSHGLIARLLVMLLPLGIAALASTGIYASLTDRRQSTSMQTLGIFAAFVFVVMIVLAIAILVGHTRIRPKHVAAALTDRNLCGSCLRNLVDTTPQSDGITTCPRCGAGWMLTPQSPTPADAPSPQPQPA